MQIDYASKRLFAPVFPGHGVISRESVRRRTHELARRAGRTPPHVTQADYEQAKRELTGETELDRQLAILDAPRAPGDVVFSSREPLVGLALAS
jgi:hypothetical protein